jgi:hypothetical protein
MKHYFDKLSKAYPGTVCSISPCGLEAHEATSNEELIKHIAEKHEKVLDFLLQKDHQIRLPPNWDKKKEPQTPPPNPLKIKESPLNRPNVKIEKSGVDLMSEKIKDESNSSDEPERKSLAVDVSSSESEVENKGQVSDLEASRKDQQNKEEKEGIEVSDNHKAEDNNNPKDDEGSKEKNDNEKSETFRFSSCEVEQDEEKAKKVDKAESEKSLNKVQDEKNGISSGIRALFDSDSDSDSD